MRYEGRLSRREHRAVEAGHCGRWWIGRCLCGWETALYEDRGEAVTEVARHVEDRVRPLPLSA